MRRSPRQLHEISQAIRCLRKALGLTQQEFAYRIPTAVRTIARWENNYPPHGQSLVRLAQLATAQGLEELAATFVRALQLEMAHHNVADQPELKGWLDGVQVAFRYRHRLQNRWAVLAQNIIDAVQYAARAADEVSSPEGIEFRDLQRQLAASLERSRDLYAEQATAEKNSRVPPNTDPINDQH